MTGAGTRLERIHDELSVPLHVHDLLRGLNDGIDNVARSEFVAIQLAVMKRRGQN
jgi:hypothetical protein